MAGNRERKKKERKRRAAAINSAASTARLQAHQVLAATKDRVRRAATAALRQRDLADHPAQIAEETLAITLRVIDESPWRSRHACQEGCAYCCHTAVTIAPPEVFAIANHLRTHCSSDELVDVRRRLDENAGLAASLSRQEYIGRLIPCALLDEQNRCLAHSVRPLACAGFLSLSRSKCEAEFNGVPDRAAVPTDDLAMSIGVSASEGILLASKESGHDGSFYELHHALRLALDHPDLASRWAAREDVFQNCPT